MNTASQHYLTVSALAVGASLLVYSAVIFGFFPDQFGRLPGIGVGLVVCIAVTLSLRRGDGPQAMWVASLGCLLYIAVAALTGGGLEAPVMMALPLLVLIPGWLLGRRVAKQIAALGLVLCIGLWLAGDAGWIDPHAHLPGLLRLWIDVVVLFVALVLTIFAVGAQKQRVVEIHQLNDNLTTANAISAQQVREFQTLANNLPALVLRLDANLRCCFVNDNFVEIQKFEREQLLGKHIDDIFTEPRRSAMHVAIKSARSGELNQLLAPYIRSEDTPQIYEGNVVQEFDIHGRSTGFLCLFYDVTERERMQVELRHAASHDPLTGLSNRLSIEDRLENAVARSEREQLQFAVLAIDLDGFKPINDTYGHSAGDALLLHVARQLTSAVRAADSVGRIGGDEFIVVLENIENDAAAEALAQKILLAVGTPVAFETQQLSVHASIGIALFPVCATRPRELVRIADEAMYQAKHAGKNCVRFGAGCRATSTDF